MDVVGISALNLDYVVPRKAFPAPLRRQLDALLGADLEVLVEDAVVDAFIAALDPAPLPTLGGSAFNAIRTVCELNLGLEVGCVGIVGRPQGDPFLRYRAERGVDTTYAFAVDAPNAKCLAEIGPTKQRRFLTGRGPTRLLAECFRDAEMANPPASEASPSGLGAYLAAARWVHVGAFPDLGALACFTPYLRVARRANPDLRVSFDIGYHYALGHPPEALELARLADVLFVSEAELRLLAGMAAADMSVPIAHLTARLFELLAQPAQTVVVKRRAETVILRWQDGQVDIRQYRHRSLPSREVQDDVGAGDVFAGGFIASHLLGLPEEHAVRLGAALVREKLRLPAAEGYAQFSRVGRELLTSILNDIQLGEA